MKMSFLLKTCAFLTVFCGILLFNGNTRAIGGVIVTPQQSTSISESKNTSAVLSSTTAIPAIPVRQRSHAPEMPTILLFLSGMVGMIVHAARVSFRAAKRILDYVISATAIIVSSPLLILLAIIVKLTSKGPAIYRQERVGLNGKTFFILKFRSMTVDAEKGTGAVWAKKNDPRVTPFGNFMRKTHLDELPQLFNVLKGEMSIVGPRPERPEMVKTLKETICDYEKRLEVLPGITGLAQVLHRYDETLTDVRKKVKYDIFYIKKMCWLTEMRIVALTCVMMLTGKVLR
jgi:lipopolysaccharide/colanic/teichoic acid biosynthesis glycosyltransferase